MIVFPGCKINLGLRILNKREDGFHNLATVFYPLPLRDALEIIRNNDPDNDQAVRLSFSGNAVDGNDTENLCVKAYHLLKQDFPELPHVKIHLHKAIPMGAGLGGGSADGAFTLKLLNEKFQLRLSTEQLIAYSLQLGSDCPFFIINQPCYATGRGEILEPVRLSLGGYQLLLVNPGIHIHTGRAFSQLNTFSFVKDGHSTIKENLKDIVSRQPADWCNELVNDFEIPVFLKYPEISAIKEELYREGAVYASMSGSGSTVFGLFEKGSSPEPHLPTDYYVKLIKLQNLLENA
jgi:4-diphosphocytidyl-2-C-methyl-D-erythritol kinase